MSKIKKGFISFGTGTNDIQASVIPTNLTPNNYTPNSTDIKGHFQGIDTRLGMLPVGAGAGVDFYLDDSASDISGYNVLTYSPTGGTEVIDSIAVTSGTSPLLIESYASSSAGIGASQIDGGTWIFSTWADVSGGTTCTIRHSVYKRTAAGAETLLFSADTSVLTTTTTLHDTETVQPAFAINSTDRLVIKYYAINSSATSRTVRYYHNGTTHYSHIHTPIIHRHNDLAGLQGGSATERYHLTSAQYTISTQTATNARDGYLSSADHTTFSGKEPGLGNPGVSGYVLSSTTGGVRSWVAAGSGSTGDIAETSYSKTLGVDQTLSNEVITNFKFLESGVRSFDALVSVQIDTTSDKWEVVKIIGIQKGSASWTISTSSSGDITGLTFDITSSGGYGQLVYSIAADASRTAINMKFRAISTSV